MIPDIIFLYPNLSYLLISHNYFFTDPSERHPDSKRNSVLWYDSEERRVQKTSVVELLVVVDHSAFDQILAKNNGDAAITKKYLEKYYRLLVTLVRECEIAMHITYTHSFIHLFKLYYVIGCLL